MESLLRTSWVELKLFRREPLTVVVTLGLPLVLLYVLGGVFGNTPDPEVYRGVGPMDYYVPAYVGLVIASIGVVGLPSHLAAYRERGVLRRFRASAVPMAAVYGAQVAVTIVVAIVASVLMIVVAALGYDIRRPSSVPLFLAGFVLSALTFAALGVLLGAIFRTSRAAQGAGLLLWFVMMILGGAGPPPEVLPDTMRSIGDATPVRHVILLLQDAWLGFGWNWSEAGIVAAFLVGAVAFALALSRGRLETGR
jgi:ABC-2 type transport system permease protein